MIQGRRAVASAFGRVSASRPALATALLSFVLVWFGAHYPDVEVAAGPGHADGRADGLSDGLRWRLWPASSTCWSGNMHLPVIASGVDFGRRRADRQRVVCRGDRSAGGRKPRVSRLFGGDEPPCREPKRCKAPSRRSLREFAKSRKATLRRILPSPIPRFPNSRSR